MPVATLAQASQMPGEDPRLCDPHISSHERSYWRAFPHIRQFLMLDFQAQKREAQMMKKQEAQILAFRNRSVMRRNPTGQLGNVSVGSLAWEFELGNWIALGLR